MNRKIKFAPGEYYHVYNRGVEKRDVFTNDADYERFQRLLYLCNGERSVIYRLVQGPTLYGTDVGKKITSIGAYVLMPNHFHLLLKEEKEGGITEFLRKLTTAYTMYFNKKYDRVGHLFQGIFKAEHVGNDEYLKYLFSYIHLNPVKMVDGKWGEKRIGDAGKAKNFLKSFQHSSYPDLSGVKRPEHAILSSKEFPGYFETAVDFEDLVDEWMKFGNESPEQPSVDRALDDAKEGEDLMAQFLET